MKDALIDNYKKCWEFFLESRWFFVFALGIFMLTFLVGFAYPIFFREEIFGMLRVLLLQLDGLGTLDLIHLIFFNNLKASFMAMIFGIFLGITPLITCVLNGYLLGFVAREAVVAEGIGSMWKIFPHGIFELPAVLFSIGIGIRVGASIVASDWAGGKDMGEVLIEGLRFFSFVVFPLLLVAGIIEGLLVGIIG